MSDVTDQILPGSLTSLSLEDVTRLLYLSSLRLSRVFPADKDGEIQKVILDLRRAEFRVLFHLSNCSHCQGLTRDLSLRRDQLQRLIQGG